MVRPKKPSYSRARRSSSTAGAYGGEVLGPHRVGRPGRPVAEVDVEPARGSRARCRRRGATTSAALQPSHGLVADQSSVLSDGDGEAVGGVVEEGHGPSIRREMSAALVRIRHMADADGGARRIDPTERAHLLDASGLHAADPPVRALTRPGAAGAPLLDAGLVAARRTRVRPAGAAVPRLPGRRLARLRAARRPDRAACPPRSSAAPAGRWAPCSSRPPVSRSPAVRSRR